MRNPQIAKEADEKRIPLLSRTQTHDFSFSLDQCGRGVEMDCEGHCCGGVLFPWSLLAI